MVFQADCAAAAPCGEAGGASSFPPRLSADCRARASCCSESDFGLGSESAGGGPLGSADSEGRP